MSRLKISAISYLNTAPLMWDFEHGDGGGRRQFRYFLHHPFGLRASCARGTADIGIIPAAAYTTIPDLVIVPD